MIPPAPTQLAFPWPEPSDVYSDAGPDRASTFVLCGATLVVTPLAGPTLTTGRRRYRVTCASCAGTQLHHATTGPRIYIEEHLETRHGWKRP